MSRLVNFMPRETFGSLILEYQLWISQYGTSKGGHKNTFGSQQMYFFISIRRDIQGWPWSMCDVETFNTKGSKGAFTCDFARIFDHFTATVP